MSSMITATAWVPRGFAAPFPKKYDFNEEEFSRIAELAQLHLDDAREDLEEAKQDLESPQDAGHEDEITENAATSRRSKKPQSTDVVDDDLKEYDLEHYDDDGDDMEGGGESGEGLPMSIFGNIKALAYHESNKDDPYITLGNADGDDDDEDREDLQILATDNLLLAAKVEDDLAQLEVYVYEDEADNLYVHHDIMLPAIPLCVEWLDIPVHKAGVAADAAANFVAIGTMDPDIEVWDLDTVDCMYPNAVLGQGGKGRHEGGGGEGEKKKNKKKKKKKNKAGKANDEFHVDAVLSLAANRKHRNLLASASADKTVKLWDLNTATCAKSYSFHTDKVCALAWHAVESTVLLSGSYDRTIAAMDMRAPAEATTPRWGVESDVENVRWDPHDANYFFVSTESGMVHYHDVRMAPATPAATKAVWTLQAHDESVSSFDINPAIPGFMATGSGDRTVKLWNIQAATGPSMVVSRNLDVGKVFSTSFAPDPEVSFRLAVAGSKGSLTVWDTSTSAAVRQAFATKMPSQVSAAGAAGKEAAEDRIVSVVDDDDDDDSSESSDEGEANGEPGGAALGRGRGGASSSQDEDESMGED